MSRSSRFLTLAVAACLAAAASVASVTERVVSAVSRGVDRLLCAFVAPFQMQAAAPAQTKPSVALVAARAFVLRLLKRRPTVHPSWRMCPSI